MKALWEEYGLIIIAVVVAAALIALTIAMSNRTSTNINKNVDSFQSVGDSAVNNALNIEIESGTDNN